MSHPSAFTRDLSRCVPAASLGYPRDAEPRSLKDICDKGHNGDYAEPEEVSVVSISDGAGYRSKVLFAVGALGVSYFCTLTAREAAKRLGMRRYWDGYAGKWVRL